jgi:uncharacterized membrane protein
MSLNVSGDWKLVLFLFLGIVVAILVLGYHHSPQASKILGEKQRNATTPNAPNSLKIFSNLPMSPVSTETYGVEKKY